MKKKRIFSVSGMSLVEIAVFGTLLAGLVGATLGVYYNAAGWINSARHRLTAVEYARQSFERLMEESPSSALLSEGSHNAPITEGLFTAAKFDSERSYEVTDEAWTGPPDTPIKIITVTVEYNEPGTSLRKTESLTGVI